MSKKISIITPSYNQAEYLEQCIDSILSQGYSNLEYIIVDGGSKDQSKSIIKKHEKHLTYWVSEPDKGQSHAINKGLKKATGDVINWINSDDYLEKGSLKTIAEKFSNPLVNVYSGRSNIVKEGKVLRQSRGLDIYEKNLPKTIGMARIDQPETWWRKSVTDQLGLLNPNLHFIMDRDWWIRYLITHGLNGIEQSDDVLANFRLHNDSKTVSQADLFNLERNEYFKNIANHYGINLSNELLKTSQKNLRIDFPNIKNKKLIEDSLNYFLFLLAAESYALSDSENFNAIYEQIDLKKLALKDQKMLNSLAKKTKYIPATILKTIKRLR